MNYWWRGAHSRALARNLTRLETPNKRRIDEDRDIRVRRDNAYLEKTPKNLDRFALTSNDSQRVIILPCLLFKVGYCPKMFHKIFIPTVVLAASAFAADITIIPFETADGKETSLSAYKGKTVLLVNVASKCGFTKQYTGLQKLYDEKKDDGLVILAFPCNDFGGQEPGSIEEIQKFCSSKFGVTFPIMAKIHVKGKEQHPLYTALTGDDGAFPGNVKWNFGKILIGKDGKPLARFGSRTKPDSDELTKAISDALGD